MHVSDAKAAVSHETVTRGVRNLGGKNNLVSHKRPGAGGGYVQETMVRDTTSTHVRGVRRASSSTTQRGGEQVGP